MTEFGIVTSGSFIELFISETAVCFTETNTVVETSRLGWDSHDSPHLAAILEEGEFNKSFTTIVIFKVKQMILPRACLWEVYKFSRWVEISSCIPGFFDEISSREQDHNLTVKLVDKRLFAELHSLFELTVLRICRRSIPWCIHISNSATQIGVDGILKVIGLVNSVVLCIDLHDQELVQFFVGQLKFFLFDVFIIELFDHGRDNFSSEMLVD